LKSRPKRRRPKDDRTLTLDDTRLLRRGDVLRDVSGDWVCISSRMKPGDTSIRGRRWSSRTGKFCVQAQRWRYMGLLWPDAVWPGWVHRLQAAAPIVGELVKLPGCSKHLEPVTA